MLSALFLILYLLESYTLFAVMASESSAVAPPCLIQFASDLHLEGLFGRKREAPLDIIIPSAKYLVLAGDICTLTPDVIAQYFAWLSRIAEGFTRVFVLAGNHEYYGTSLAEGRATLASVCASDPRIVHLDRTRIELEEGIVLLGCTLWSHIPRHAESSVLGLLNDYRVIRPATGDLHSTPRRFGCSAGLARAIHAELSAEHDADLGWLTDEIGRAAKRGQRVIVATHHAPAAQGTSAPQFSTPLWNPTNAGFATSLEHLFALFGTVATLTGEADLPAPPSSAKGSGIARVSPNSTVRAWIFGHTHFNCDNTIFGTVRYASVFVR
jgi:hypothetical protein